MRLPTRTALAVMLISTMLLIGLPEVAQAAPNPNDCNPANQNVEVTEFPSGIKYRCVCLTSVTTGKTYCQWKAEGPKASSDLQIGAEWGTSGQLNYGETANTDDGFLRSFGQTSNFNNGLLSNVGSGSLADALTVFNWTGSAWNKCLDSGFYYNGPPAAAFNLTWNFNSPPCGDGYYATNNYGFVWDGARWQGNLPAYGRGTSSGKVARCAGSHNPPRRRHHRLQRRERPIRRRVERNPPSRGAPAWFQGSARRVEKSGQIATSVARPPKTSGAGPA